jgi:hypothetical protein
MRRRQDFALWGAELVVLLDDPDRFHVVKEPHAIQCLDGRRMIDDSPRRADDFRFGVDDLHRNAGAGKLERGHEPDRSGADDNGSFDLLDHAENPRERARASARRSGKGSLVLAGTIGLLATSITWPDRRSPDLRPARILSGGDFGNNPGRAWRLVRRLGVEENAAPAARRGA